MYLRFALNEFLVFDYFVRHFLSAFFFSIAEPHMSVNGISYGIEVFKVSHNLGNFARNMRKSHPIFRWLFLSKADRQSDSNQMLAHLSYEVNITFLWVSDEKFL